MRHSNNRILVALAALSLGLLPGGRLAAQQPLPPPRDAGPAAPGNALVLPINGTQRLQMTSRRRMFPLLAVAAAALLGLAGCGDSHTKVTTGTYPGESGANDTDEHLSIIAGPGANARSSASLVSGAMRGRTSDSCSLCSSE